jgi:hypothetical protein
MFRGRDVELKTILLGHRPERVWTGGSGEAIVLPHGAAQVPEAVGWRRGPVIHLTDMLF